MKRLLFAFLLIMTACASVGQQASGPIKIGALAALTGNLATISSDERIGLDIAVEEINANGGINGRNLEVIWEDGKCDPKEATTAATKLIQVDGVKVIMGGTCTGESMAIARLANESQIIQMSAVTSGSVYSNTGEWTFRTNPVDNAKDLVEYLFSKGYKNFALISEQTDFSQSIRKDFKHWVEQNGGTVVADENFPSSETDFRTGLGKMKQGAPDAYFINTNSGAVGVNVARQAKELGLLPLFASRGFETIRVSDFPNELEGIIFYGTVGVVDMDTPQARKLFDAYRAKTGKEPFSPFAIASRYDGMMVVASAIKACGENTACIRDKLSAMPPHDGVTGTFTFDQNGDPVGLKYAFSLIHDGKLTRP